MVDFLGIDEWTEPYQKFKDTTVALYDTQGEYSGSLDEKYSWIPKHVDIILPEFQQHADKTLLERWNKVQQEQHKRDTSYEKARGKQSEGMSKVENRLKTKDNVAWTILDHFDGMIVDAQI